MLAREGESDEQLVSRWEGRVRDRVKPCWELDFCPYGPLVEEYPLLPREVKPVESTREDIEKPIRESSCSECGASQEVEEWVLDDWRGQLERLNVLPDKETIPKVFITASCKAFGHLCPVCFLAEEFTETDNIRSNGGPSVPPAMAIRVARRDNYTCQLCGTPLLDRDIEFDHVIPIGRGGATKESNLRVTCRKCNRAKGVKPDHA